MPASDVYPNLLHLVEGRDYFILTTNVDHAFQRSGAAKERIFYTQGDYGLFQSSRPTGASAGKTYDNEESVRAMLTAQGFAFAEDGTLLPPESDAPVMVIPSDLIPCCPDDGMEMATNLRADGSFVEDAGWHAAAARYTDYLTHTEGRRTLLLELGVGMNTPGIIKYPFWRMTAERADVTFAAMNLGRGYVPPEIAPRSMIINGDIAKTLRMLAS
jgi:SIR2 family protein